MHSHPQLKENILIYITSRTPKDLPDIPTTGCYFHHSLALQDNYFISLLLKQALTNSALSIVGIPDCTEEIQAMQRGLFPHAPTLSICSQTVCLAPCFNRLTIHLPKTNPSMCVLITSTFKKLDYCNFPFFLLNDLHFLFTGLFISA